MLLQQRLLVPRYPSEDLGRGACLLDEIVDVEVNRDVGLVLADIGRSPGVSPGTSASN